MFQIILTGAWHLANEQLKSGWTLSTHEGFTGRTVEVHRKPLGVALCLVPWNAPAPMAVHKAANSLAAGCPTSLKPTEWAPNGCDILAEAVHKAKLPDTLDFLPKSGLGFSFFSARPLWQIWRYFFN